MGVSFYKVIDSSAMQTKGASVFSKYRLRIKVNLRSLLFFSLNQLFMHGFQTIVDFLLCFIQIELFFAPLPPTSSKIQGKMTGNTICYTRLLNPTLKTNSLIKLRGYKFWMGEFGLLVQLRWARFNVCYLTDLLNKQRAHFIQRRLEHNYFLLYLWMLFNIIIFNLDHKTN